jgi:hypothetical protein
MRICRPRPISRDSSTIVSGRDSLLEAPIGQRKATARSASAGRAIGVADNKKPRTMPGL